MNGISTKGCKRIIVENLVGELVAESDGTWFFFPSGPFKLADVRGQTRQPELGGRHAAGSSRGLPAVIRSEVGQLRDVPTTAWNAAVWPH